MNSTWEKRRQTITADELFSAPASVPLSVPDDTRRGTPPYVAPAPVKQGWIARKLTGAHWPWREIALMIGACVFGATVWLVITSMDITPPSIPRRGQAALVGVIPTATPQPTAQPPTTPAPVIVTATPPQPVYVAPVAPPQPAQRSDRRQLPPPAPTQAQPAAWPAPQQRITIVDPNPPTAEPREPLVTVEYYRCSDGFSYTPSAWDVLFGPTIEPKGNGIFDIIEGTGGVYNQPLRHKGCRVESYRR